MDVLMLGTWTGRGWVGLRGRERIRGRLRLCSKPTEDIVLVEVEEADTWRS